MPWISNRNIVNDKSEKPSENIYSSLVESWLIFPKAGTNSHTSEYNKEIDAPNLQELP